METGFCFAVMPGQNLKGRIATCPGFRGSRRMSERGAVHEAVVVDLQCWIAGTLRLWQVFCSTEYRDGHGHDEYSGRRRLVYREYRNCQHLCQYFGLPGFVDGDADSGEWIAVYAAFGARLDGDHAGEHISLCWGGHGDPRLQHWDEWSADGVEQRDSAGFRRTGADGDGGGFDGRDAAGGRDRFVERQQ